ncbi:hypothetical protein B0A49_13086, partial [Cryomyces minteri]
QLERVEKALSTLIDSIVSYNPSIAAAEDLVAADDDFSTGLERLVLHQKNHARILSLRNTYESNDDYIKSTLTQLARLRSDLLATSATTFPPGSRDVPYDQLLAYAKHISKFTVPPTFRAKTIEGSQQQPANLTDARPQAQQRPTNGITASPTAAEGAPDGEPQIAFPEGIGLSSLDREQKNYLDPNAKLPWVPWPSPEVIRGGALGHVQSMAEQGIDLAAVLTPEQQASEDKRRADELRRAQEREEEASRQMAALVGAGQRRDHLQEEAFSGLDDF